MKDPLDSAYQHHSFTELRTVWHSRTSTSGRISANAAHLRLRPGFQYRSDHRKPNPDNRGRRFQTTRTASSETVSGSPAIEQRPGFIIKLLNTLKQHNVLTVTKPDRLGRNAIDVDTTVARLAEMRVQAGCLVLGGVDLPALRAA
jgi:DNA invertase Pin-like site-specific DNA recombinase